MRSFWSMMIRAAILAVLTRLEWCSVCTASSQAAAER